MHAFRVLDAEVHPALNEIRVGERVERLPPKFIDVLVALAERADAVVTKSELLGKVWGDPMVGDEALSHAIWVLRKTLGDDAKRPRYIQTVPRRGYRLKAPVNRLDGNPETDPRASPSPLAPDNAPATAESETLDRSIGPSVGRSTAKNRPGFLMPALVLLAIMVTAWLGLRTAGEQPAVRSNTLWRLGDRLTRFDRLDDGRLLMATRSSELLAWSPGQPQPDWRIRLGAPSVAGSLQSGKLLLVPSDDHFLYAFDIQSGREQWRVMADAAIRARPALAQGSVLFGDDHGTVSRVDLSSRQTLWRTSLGGRLRLSVLVVGDQVAVADTDGRLSTLSLSDGAVQSQVSLGRAIDVLSDLGSQDASMAGDILVGTEAGKLQRFNLRTQAVRWEADTGDASGDPVFLNQHAFLLTRQGSGWLLDMHDGRPLWRANLSVPGSQQPVLTSSGVSVSLAEARLGLIDPDTGRLRVRIRMPAAIDWVQAVDRGDALGLAVAGLDGQIRFIEGVALLAHGDWRLTDSGRLAPDQARSAEPSNIELVHSSESVQASWQVQTQGNAQDVSFMANGDVLVGDASGVTRLDPRGERVWHFATGQSPGTQFTVSGRLVLFGGNDGALYALEADSGVQRWRFATGDKVRSRPVVDGRRVVFGGVDSAVYCLNLGDGTLRWQFRTDGPIHAEVVVADGWVYAGSGDQHLYALDLESGQLRWRRPVQEWIVAAPLLDHHTLFVPVSDGSIRALMPESGAEIWRFSSNGPIWFGLVSDGERLFFASGDGHVYAVDASTGRERWRQRIGPQAEGRLALGQGRLFAGSPEGYLYALDAVSGEVLWRMRAGGAVFNPAVQVPNLAVGSADQVLHMLRIDAEAEALPAQAANRETVTSSRP